MNTVSDTAFSLLTGFGYVHIMIVAVLAAFLGSLASAIVWSARRRFAKALPGAVFVLLVPPVMIGIIPGLEFLAVPLAILVLALTFLTHMGSGEDRGTADTILALVLGFALLALIIVFAISSLSGPATE